MDKAGAGDLRMGELGRGLVEPARAFGRKQLRGDNVDVYGVTLEEDQRNRYCRHVWRISCYDCGSVLWYVDCISW